jgi:hypothetical protein
MKIESLIICGAGTNAPYYVGIFHCLFTKKIVDPKLIGIKEILTTSVGILASILILLNIDMRTSYKIMDHTEIHKLINYDNISLDSLLKESGLFDIDNLSYVIELIIYHKTGIKQCTLKQLYDLTKISLNVTVYNITDSILEVFNYMNHPDITIEQLASMTMSIPLFFKPILYKNNYYLDGGVDTLDPSLLQYKNYLRLDIISKSIDNDLLPLFKTMISLIKRKKKKKKDARNIYIYCKTGIVNFNMSQKDKKMMVIKGYNDTIKHLRFNKLID